MSDTNAELHDDNGTGHVAPPEVAPGGLVVTHLTCDERVALGKKARADVPRSSHGAFEPAPGRDPIALLEEQAESRVPELVPIRYGRMLSSPFAFYRGAALVMAQDLSTTPRSGLRVQVCGDAHLANFGVFGTPERLMIFDVNDFDETLPGPWEWDLKRLAASIMIAGQHRNFTAAENRSAVLGTVASYRNAMTTFASQTNLDVWYAKLDIDQAVAQLGKQVKPITRKRTEASLAKARTHDSMQAFSKLTTEVDGKRRIISDPPLIVPISELLPGVKGHVVMEGIHDLLRRYRFSLESDRQDLLEQFRMVDMARKVVGVGSVGTRAWIVLMLGRDDEDPLFLQAKEAQASVLERFVGASTYENHGHRVVAGQRLMQASSDIFLGWERADGIDGQERDFYFRQLRDWKGSADLDNMIPSGMTMYGTLCGWTLARAHARSGDRVQIAAYLGKGDVFDQAIADFSVTYAEQNARDYAALQKAVADGRVVAETGV